MDVESMNDESRVDRAGVDRLGFRGRHSLGGVPTGKFLTVAEVAATVRLSKMSVYRLIHSGQLEAVQFGRSFRVSEKALDAYLQSAFYDAG